MQFEGEAFQVRHFSEQLAIATFSSALFITLIQRFSDGCLLGIDTAATGNRHLPGAPGAPGPVRGGGAAQSTNLL